MAGDNEYIEELARDEPPREMEETKAEEHSRPSQAELVNEYEEFEEPILCARCEGHTVNYKGDICGACVDEIDHN